MNAQTVYRVTWNRGGKPKSKVFRTIGTAQRQIAKLRKPYTVSEAAAKKHRFLKPGKVDAAESIRLDVGEITWFSSVDVTAYDVKPPARRRKTAEDVLEEMGAEPEAMLVGVVENVVESDDGGWLVYFTCPDLDVDQVEWKVAKNPPAVGDERRLAVRIHEEADDWRWAEVLRAAG